MNYKNGWIASRGRPSNSRWCRSVANSMLGLQTLTSWLFVAGPPQTVTSWLFVCGVGGEKRWAPAMWGKLSCVMATYTPSAPLTSIGTNTPSGAPSLRLPKLSVDSWAFEIWASECQDWAGGLLLQNAEIEPRDLSLEVEPIMWHTSKCLATLTPRKRNPVGGSFPAKVCNHYFVFLWNNRLFNPTEILA